MDEDKKRRLITIARVSMKLIKRAQIIGEALHDMDNPFIGHIRPRLDKREKFVTDFANYLQQKAHATVESGEPDSALFCTDANTDWLLDEVDKILEVEQWTAAHMARLASLCFYLLSTGPDVIDEAGE